MSQVSENETSAQKQQLLWRLRQLLDLGVRQARGHQGEGEIVGDLANVVEWSDM